MGHNRKPPKDNVRRVGHIGGGAGRNIPGVRMNKAGRRVQFESHSEELLMQRLDRDTTVTDYISQPESLTFLDELGKPHTYTPDIKVLRIDGSVELHEVSMSSRRVEPNIIRREKAAQQICRARGWKYIVHTEHDLPDLTEQANLRILEGYRAKSYYNQIHLAALNIQLSVGTKTNLRELVLVLATQCQAPLPSIVSTIFHNLWHRSLECNIKNELLLMDGRVTNKVIVWRPRPFSITNGEQL